MTPAGTGGVRPEATFFPGLAPVARRFRGGRWVRMPTFIDESGDTGIVAHGGKPYFRLAAVWLPDPDAFREAVRLLRRACDSIQLGIKSATILAFRNSSPHPRRSNNWGAQSLP